MALLQETTMTIDGNTFTTQTYMSDFQDVDGLIMPYSVETKMGGNVVSQIMFKTVVLNEKIDDSIFNKPAPEAPAAPIKE